MENYSVLLSVYYKEKPEYLENSIESIMNQTVVTNDFVIVKDGNLTKELDIVIDYYEKKYPDIISIKSLNQNVGLGKALNYGLQFCKNRIVARMDSDDISYKDRFEKQLKVFEENPGVVLVGSWIDESFDMVNVITRRIVPENNNTIIEFSKKRCPVNHVSVMFIKNAVETAGGYLECHYNEDYYLWVRMIENKAVFYNVQESLVLVRIGREMYKRRGGYRYFKSELFIQKYMFKHNQISIFTLTYNVLIRFFIQVILPPIVRGYVFKKIARKAKKING